MKLSEILNKPLPMIPTDTYLENFLEEPESPHDNVAKAPQASTVNLVTVGGPKSTPKSNSSHVVRHSLHVSSGSTDILSSQSKDKPESLGYKEIGSFVFPTSEDATNVSKNLSSLTGDVGMEDTNMQTIQPLGKHRGAKHYFKVPRLQKSREVFTRAKRAISERLGSSLSSKEDIKWKRTHNRRKSSQSPSLAEAFSEGDQLDDNDSNLQKLNRRLAEGANLSNPKIKVLIGDGLVTRKPLPMYESMKSPAHWSDSFDDPFSDEQPSSHGTSSLGLLDPEYNNSGRKTRKSRRISPHELLLSSAHLPVPIDNLSLRANPDFRQLSDTVSGLRQHPNVRFFSSSPVGFSTPRFRLEPEIGASGNKRLSIVPASELSLLDLNFDGLSDDEICESRELKFNKSDLSLKRKTLTVDHGVERAPAAKKAKTDNMQLASNLAMLNRGPLTVRDHNMRLARVATSKGTGQGPQLLEFPEKAPISRGTGSVRTIKAGLNTKRSSIPVSFKSAKSRQSRCSTPALIGPLQHDSLSADELQME